jgi:hypothetical protein
MTCSTSIGIAPGRAHGQFAGLILDTLSEHVLIMIIMLIEMIVISDSDNNNSNRKRII